MRTQWAFYETLLEKSFYFEKSFNNMFPHWKKKTIFTLKRVYILIRWPLITITIPKIIAMCKILLFL